MGWIWYASTMQTFLPYSSFRMTAEVLDRQRLGKQRVEALQILRILRQGEWTCPNCPGPVTHFNPYKTGHHCYYCEAPLKRVPWSNHPAVHMWKGYEGALMEYLHAMCYEWTAIRGYKDTCWVKAIEVGPPPPNVGIKTKMPPWMGDQTFHLSHQSNLLRKNHEHYGQFFMGIPDDLPYVWPVQHNGEEL